ncbi:MAG TPA: hypothetical protein VMI54_22305 [Polyangiaceae bacterium]|nr:hypothetical protein [Polyangiaceae bacterium]
MKEIGLGWFLTGSLFLSACQAVVEGPPTLAPAGAAGSVGQAGSGAVLGEGGTTATGGTTSSGSGGSAVAAGTGGSSSSGVGGSAMGGMTNGGSSSVTGTGPLCDALAMLRQKCQSCHSNPPSPRSVPMSLVSYADLVAPAPADPTVSTAEMCIQRMQDTSSPMPPAPATPATAADVQVLQAWIDAGEPSTCDAGTAGAAGSTAAGGSGGAVTNPYDTPLTCTSMQYWTGGNHESPDMHPGGACITCHTSGGEEEGPRFTFAGTVFPSAHEPDDCNGLDGSTAMTEVVVTDANGSTFTMNVNSVGNFSYTARTAPVMPYTAKVVSGSNERAMSAKQMTGDCNSCHTQDGANDAPGRIMAP